jgi:hypothetical protein
MTISNSLKTPVDLVWVKLTKDSLLSPEDTILKTDPMHQKVRLKEERKCRDIMELDCLCFPNRNSWIGRIGMTKSTISLLILLTKNRIWLLKLRIREENLILLLINQGREMSLLEFLWIALDLWVRQVRGVLDWKSEQVLWEGLWSRNWERKK